MMHNVVEICGSISVSLMLKYTERTSAVVCAGFSSNRVPEIKKTLSAVVDLKGTVLCCNVLNKTPC